MMISLIGVVYDANVENNLRHGYVCIRIERISIVNIMRIFFPLCLWIIVLEVIHNYRIPVMVYFCKMLMVCYVVFNLFVQCP